jgi:hypothetical protein
MYLDCECIIEYHIHRNICLAPMNECTCVSWCYTACIVWILLTVKKNSDVFGEKKCPKGPKHGLPAFQTRVFWGLTRSRPGNTGKPCVPVPTRPGRLHSKPVPNPSVPSTARTFKFFFCVCMTTCRMTWTYLLLPFAHHVLCVLFCVLVHMQ